MGFWAGILLVVISPLHANGDTGGDLMASSLCSPRHERLRSKDRALTAALGRRGLGLFRYGALRDRQEALNLTAGYCVQL
jgi:hypothetical protein